STFFPNPSRPQSKISTNPVTLNGSTLTVAVTDGFPPLPTLISSPITGTGGLVVAGGSLVLTGIETYTRPTPVNGRLELDGSLVPGGGPVTVNGTLSGNGVIQRAVEVFGFLSAGVIPPTRDRADPGRLTTGDLTFHAGSTLQEDIDGPNAGTDYDQLVVNGT